MNLEQIAIAYGVTTFETSQKLQIHGFVNVNGHSCTKMRWVEYCPNYVVENGFEVCRAEKVIALAYPIELVPFRFRNGCDYYLVDSMKRLKRGSVYNSWVAPQIHEIPHSKYQEAYKELFSRLT